MRWFITGTDTEVGKSVVTACLAQALRLRGSTLAAKPVASGVPEGTAGEDATLIAAGAGHEPLCALTLVPPVSPHRALLDLGRSVPAARFEDFIGSLAADHVLVEGVGGWRVPVSLDEPVVVPDLARWTRGPVLVVARDRLGVLNHTALTLEAIRRDGFEVLGVVLNRFGEEEPPASNLQDLRLLLDVPVLPMGPLDPWDPTAREQAGEALLMGLLAGSDMRATVPSHGQTPTEEPT